jgi:phage baseplate assembly protein W
MAAPSVADRYSATRSKEQFLYSDFLTNFNAHPDSKQLMTIKNEVAVTRSIKNLLLTNKYERLFQPTIGSNLRNFLFEPISPQTEASLKTQIIRTIENHEPRAKLIDTVVTGYPEQNGYIVTIVFYTTTIINPITINIPLIRVR